MLIWRCLLGYVQQESVGLNKNRMITHPASPVEEEAGMRVACNGRRPRMGLHKTDAEFLLAMDAVLDEISRSQC